MEAESQVKVLARRFSEAYERLKECYSTEEFQEKINHWINVVQEEANIGDGNRLTAIARLIEANPNPEDGLWVAATGARFAMLKVIDDPGQIPNGFKWEKETHEKFFEQMKRANQVLREIYPQDFEGKVRPYVDRIFAFIKEFGGDPLQAMVNLLALNQFQKGYSKAWFFAALIEIAYVQIEMTKQPSHDTGICGCLSCQQKRRYRHD